MLLSLSLSLVSLLRQSLRWNPVLLLVSRTPQRINVLHSKSSFIPSNCELRNLAALQQSAKQVTKSQSTLSQANVLLSKN
ncbi:hypothetical protein PCI56_06075 [Plesiomonas shigelloides subsp. oncorhynchi]|nr:hypothetical protein [Plesiomonas shigelloides]